MTVSSWMDPGNPGNPGQRVHVWFGTSPVHTLAPSHINSAKQTTLPELVSLSGQVNSFEVQFHVGCLHWSTHPTLASLVWNIAYVFEINGDEDDLDQESMVQTRTWWSWPCILSCLAGSAPPYLAELCIPVSSVTGRRQNLRSASRGTLVVPRVRTERYGRRGFSVSGPHLWNSLPPRIRSLIEKPDLFKRELKHNLCSNNHSTSEVFFTRGTL